MKTCSKCKIEKPFEAFSKSKDKKDGYRSSCKECVKLRYLELKKNPLMQLEAQIKSSILLENKLLKRENKKLCTRCKEVFSIEDLISGVFCKECSRIQNKEYEENNKEKMKELHKKHRKKHYEKNKEYALEYAKEYYEKNKENINKKKKEYLREYRQKNNEKINEKQKQYRLKKKLEKPQNNDLNLSN